MIELLNKLKFLIVRMLGFDDSSRIASLLTEFRENCGCLQLQFEGDSKLFSCTVEAMNVDHGVLVIGNVFPGGALQSLYKGRNATLRISESGFKTEMPSRFSDLLIAGNGELLTFTFPRVLQTQQLAVNEASRMTRLSDSSNRQAA